VESERAGRKGEGMTPTRKKKENKDRKKKPVRWDPKKGYRGAAVWGRARGRHGGGSFYSEQDVKRGEKKKRGGGSMQVRIPQKQVSQKSVGKSEQKRKPEKRKN